MLNMSAYLAQSQADAVVDRTGCIWLRSGGVQGMWDYVTEYVANPGDSVQYGLTGWDYREDLPAEYEPYAELDNAAEKFIRLALRQRV